MSAFLALAADLPRKGTGKAAGPARAPSRAGVQPGARILDAGSGPGADFGGRPGAAPDARAVTVDTHPPLANAVNDTCGHDPRAADTEAEEGPFDFTVIAGVLDCLGIEQGRRAMRDKLAPGAAVAFSERVHLVSRPVSRPAPDVQATQGADDPQMGGIDTRNAPIAAAGHGRTGQQLRSDFASEAYHTPMEARIALLRPGAGPALAAGLDEARAGIDIWRAFRRSFGDALSVVRPR